MKKIDKIVKIRDIWVKTFDTEKSSQLLQQIELIEKCDCGGWVTSFEHHYDWCGVHKKSTYQSFAQDDLDF